MNGPTTTAAGNTPGRPALDGTAGKGTQDGTQPPAGEPTLSSDVLDLLTAIRDTVDVPLPSTDEADERAWQHLMYQRLTDLHVSLDVALSPKWTATMDPADEAAHIRARTAAVPVTYAVFERDGGAK